MTSRVPIFENRVSRSFGERERERSERNFAVRESVGVCDDWFLDVGAPPVPAVGRAGILKSEKDRDKY